MRLYKDLEDRSPKELKELEDMVKTHPDLTWEEKQANLANIRYYQGYNELDKVAILKDIEDSQADIDDIGD